MYTFLVLGLVPGTNIQITFIIWLECIEALLLAVSLYILGRRLVRAGRNSLSSNHAVGSAVPAKLLHH